MFFNAHKYKAVLHCIRHSVWTFPLIVLVFLLCFTVLAIHGSSVGTYYTITHDSQSQDPDLLYGRPKPIRSDEFLTMTPLTILQYKSDFPEFNEKIGSGRDVSLQPDAPTKDWVTIFRPQNWSFFVMPLENAFAFRWWFGSALLISSVYFFVMRMLDRNKLLSILLSLSFGLSPFLLWWDQSSLFIPLTYTFMLLILGMRVIDQEKIPFIKSKKLTNAIYILALFYILASFGLFLYAPFLIPLALVVALFLVGYLIDSKYIGLSLASLANKELIKRIGIFAAALILASIILAVFVIEHKDAIQAVANSVYPGERRVASGDLPFSPLYRFFDSFLMPLLPHPPTGKFYTNQSEAANFILLLPFLLIPSVLLQIYDYRKNKKINFIFLFINILSTLFILRISAPIADFFFKLLLLDRVPNNRLMIGVGVLGFLQLIFLIKYLQKVKISKNLWLGMATLFSTLTLGWLLIFSRYFFDEYINNYFIVGLLAVFFTAIIAAFLFKKIILGSALLLIFTLVSSYNILPLQKGLAFSEDSKIINRMEQVSKSSDSWAVVDNFTFETFPWMAGRQMISGPQLYTDLKFWRQIDKEGKLEDIYNRQAHAIFVTNTAAPSLFLPQPFAKTNHELELVKGNVFKVKFSCSEFVYENVDFVLTTHTLNLPCLTPIDEVDYPKVNFYIYEVKSAQ